MPLPLLLPLAIAGGAELFKTLHAGNRKRKAEEGLAELEKTPRQQYQTGEQIYDESYAKAKGLSPEEKAFALHQLNQLATKRYNMAVNTAPNQASAINAGINYGSIQGQLGLVAQDAQRKRENLSQLIGLIGTQSNRRVADSNAYRDRTEASYGQAISDNDRNMVSGIEGLGQMAFAAGVYGADKQPIKKDGTPPFATAPYNYNSYLPSAEPSTGDNSNIYGDLNELNPLSVIFGKRGRKNPLEY